MAYKFNADLTFPSILALSTSIGALFLSETLLSYSTQNPENSIVNLLIQLLLFILVPATFLLGTGLLIIQAAVPFNSPLRDIYAVRVNEMTKISVIMALMILLAGLGIGVYLVLPQAIAAWWFVEW